MIQAKAPLQSDGVKYVEIPKGWRRILENGSIHYISPSSSYLKSYENIIDYLKKDGTCKCGLDCPFHVHRVFNFDTSVQNKEQKDDLINSESHSSTCKLCDSNWQNGKSFVDSRLLQKPINQTLKPTAKKPQQFSFDSSLNKKVVNRSRAKLADGPKAKKPRKVSSPLSDIPSPPPIPISSPVQNVPNNLGALNQGPLPSFASIVSSSKFFNPGPNRGPLHPTGSVPLQGNNNFSFPRILTPDISKSVTATSPNTGVVNIMTSSGAFTSTATGYTTASSTIMTKAAAPKTAVTKPTTDKIASESTAAVRNTVMTSSVVPKTISSTVSVVQNTTSQSDKKLTVKDTSASSLLMATSQSTSISCSVLPNMVSNAVCLVKTIPTPTITNNKTVIMPIINTPTLPSVFAPLDGLPTTDTVKSKPPPKTKRSRPSRAKPKPKPEMKLDDKSKMVKMVGSTPAMMSSGISTHPVPSHWPMTISHVPYQTPSTTVVSAVNSTLSVASSHTADNLSRPAIPQQVAMPSPIYMTTNHCQKQGQTMQISSPPVPNLQVAQPPLNPSSSIGSDSATSAPVVTPTNTYSVVATPRIQAPPGMMYVAAAPGVGMFSPTYPYTTGTPQLQITQASVSQQNKTALTTTPVVTTSQQTVTQGMTTESAQGKISFQVPGMYVQGTSANQMFPVNSQGFGVNQYKVPYQLQNAIYPNAGNAMTFITPNGAKATYPGLQTVATGNIGQFAYPNPYMFGIVMPTTTTQQSTSSSTSSTPGTPTSVTTSLHMIQPQSIQNPAVAAAFESFVPIAPAAAGATPRFAQTLAHLASAYNTFPQAGLVQGTNHLQLAYQMMQMNPHGNGQQIANLGGLGTADAVSKHPTTSSGKQGSSDSAKGSSNTKSKASSNSPASNSPSTPVTQDNGGPFASLNTTTPSTTPSSHCTSTTASAFQPQQVVTSGHSQQLQEKLIDCPSESKNTKTPDQQSMDNDSETDGEWKANSLCVAGAKQTTNGPMTTDQSESTSPSHNISPLSKQKNTTLSEFDASKPSSETESQKYQAVNASKSPLRTGNVFEQNTVHPIENSGQANSHYSKQEFQSYQSALETKAPTNTIDNREPMKSPNFVDKVNYYETNPLLGMKRSCEAIEVYPDPPEHLDEEDKEDFYSSNGESPEGNVATSECTLDRRHGDSSSIEDSYKAGAIQNAAKGLHNGGCNAAHSEQDTFHGSSVKPNIAAEPYQSDVFGDLPIPNVRPHFDIGDIVWAQARGLPSWPGKIVDENKVGKGKADDGKKWVMWFGDHTFSQVEVDRLKTLNEGLRSLDDKTRKKKYRAKKTRISLEQAITEALEELEMREQLKARQGVRSKGKKKRLR